MKKILLLLFISINFQLFSYYKSDNMIDFLIHSNQVRIRTDRLGVLAGTENVRFAAGITGGNIASDVILHNLGDPNTQATNKDNNNKKGVDKFVPSALVAFGYDAGPWGIGVGYEFTWKSPTYMVHTPVLTATALEDRLRINIPFSVGVGQDSYVDGNSLKGTTVLSTSPEIRYYFNTPYFSHFRLYMNYGHSTLKSVENPSSSFVQQSVGGELRLYFRVETENVLIEPIFRARFDMALATTYKNVTDTSKIVDSYSVSAKGFIPSDPGGTGANIGSGGASAIGTLQGGYIASVPSGYYAKEPYRIGVAIPVGFTAKSDDENITLYLEPALSFTILNAKEIYTFGQHEWEDIKDRHRRTNPFYTLGYVVYGELYIKPVKNLEWYTELQTGGATVAGDLASTSSTSIVFNGSTGINYYF